MYYLEYCLELNEEREEGCVYEYYALHDNRLREKDYYVDDQVYYKKGTREVPVVLKVWTL